MNEFELIRQYFQRPASNALLGVGDDAALLLPTPGRALAVSSDMLVCDRHFFADTDPYWLGHKALAVNLSDMAAMGARPRWFLLSLALPAVDKDWLARFSAGLFSLADAHEVSLVGGDTTRGPLNLSLQIIGEVSPEQALRRDQALPGDDIWISGQVGEAALALRHLQQQVTLPAADVEALLPRLQAPQPRVSLGLALAPYSRCAIDISDGLVADLGHICAASACAAPGRTPARCWVTSADETTRQDTSRLRAGNCAQPACALRASARPSHRGALRRGPPTSGMWFIVVSSLKSLSMRAGPGFAPPR